MYHVGSFKIPYEENDSRYVCFGFDEALETFGMKYVKQNITGNVIDEKTLETKLKHVKMKGIE